jgi:hypothetical protein
MMARSPRLLGLWPAQGRPEPQPCPHCGGWLWPLSDELWYCPACGWLWPEPEPKPTVGIQLGLGLNGHGGRVFVPGSRRYVDRFGNEVLRR